MEIQCYPWRFRVVRCEIRLSLEVQSYPQKFKVIYWDSRLSMEIQGYPWRYKVIHIKGYLWRSKVIYRDLRLSMEIKGYPRDSGLPIRFKVINRIRKMQLRPDTRWKEFFVVVVVVFVVFDSCNVTECSLGVVLNSFGCSVFIQNIWTDKPEHLWMLYLPKLFG